jgi:uncharacterized protein YndB with AHSA1/START domain
MESSLNSNVKQSLPVHIEWTFNTSIEKLWQAWTDPSIVKQWFGSDPGGTVINAELNVIPDGQFEIQFKDSDETIHTCFGLYTEVDLNLRLGFTWSWKSEPGHISFVTVGMEKVTGGSRLHFEHAGLNPGSAHNYETGWNNTFLKLDNYLNKVCI